MGMTLSVYSYALLDTNARKSKTGEKVRWTLSLRYAYVMILDIF